MAEKIKSRRNASLDYWERREKEALKQTRASEEEFAEKIGQVYKDMRRDINDRISRWYVRYANDSEIDITEAKKRVSKLDIEEYAELAKKYVALSRSQETRAEAFTDEANEQMKIYNLTMKINRLENLKAQMGLDLCGGFSRLQKNYGEFLTDQMMQEFTRQSGILGMTTTNPRRFRRQMEAIVNGSFHNATFSQRLWNQQDALKGELDRLLTRALIQGLNPRTVAPELKKKFDSSEQAADLLMITELCRVQTEAQKLAFQEFSYDDYTFICNGGACKECEALNGKHFKVKDMQAGRNAPPMHPRCRCSTAAYMDREAFEKWLEGNKGIQRGEFENEEDLKTRVASSFNTDNYNSGPVMDSLNAPEITNSDEIVEHFLNSIEVPNDQRIIEIISKSARHMSEEDLNMILSKGLIVKKTDGANAFVKSRRSRGKDGNLKHVIRLNSNSKEPFVFAHECAHFAEKVNELYKDPQFVTVLKNFGKSITSIEAGEVDNECYCVGISPLLIEPYQGRTYIKHLGRLGPEKPLHLEHFVEYISDGYECFVGDPKLLESKDPLLYNYFKRRGLR